MAVSLGYTNPKPFLGAVFSSVKGMPHVGFEIIDRLWSELQQHSYAAGVEDVFERACEAYCVEANLRLMHSAGDLLAQAVNASLGLGLDETECSFAGVAKRLSEVSDCSLVTAELTRFEVHKDWKYADAFVTTVKHRRSIQPKSWQVSMGEGGYREGHLYEAFGFASRGKSSESRQLEPMHREDLREMLDPLAERIDDVLAAVLTVLEQRCVSSGERYEIHPKSY